MKQLIFGITCGLALGLATEVRAQHGCGMGSSGHDHGSSSGGHDHASSAEALSQSRARSEAHGGCSAMTKAHGFEVVYLAEGIRLYVYDGQQNPISARGVEGLVTLSGSDGRGETLTFAYAGAHSIGDDSALVLRDHLFAALDLSKAKPKDLRASFRLANLPQSGEREASFQQTFVGVTQRPFMCPMHPDVWGDSARSKCPLCGMWTTDKRPTAAQSQKLETEDTADHEHGG